MGGQIWFNDSDVKEIKSIIDHFFFRWHQAKYHPAEIHDAMRKVSEFEIKEDKE